MIRLEMELIRHALQTASERGFSEIEISLGDDSFEASFQPRKADPKKGGESKVSEPATKTITAPSVGYYRPGKAPLLIGQEISVGDVVGEIAALGLKNEVTSKWAGSILQILVTPEQPVEFGQPIAVLRLPV